ncbi:hypothetical protein KEM56_000956 [Ascosphaera pollenicola]|nr:hypothetical protein KEM56_000956 [Ascosphaera pollenicola]
MDPRRRQRHQRHQHPLQGTEQQTSTQRVPENYQQFSTMAAPRTPLAPAAVFQAAYTGPEHPENAPAAASNQTPIEQNFVRQLKKPLPTPHAAGPTPMSSSDRVAAKIAYLNELRELVPHMQADINNFLTARMEADKAALGEGKSAADRKREEEEEANYGEENVELEDM